MPPLREQLNARYGPLNRFAWQDGQGRRGDRRTDPAADPAQAGGDSATSSPPRAAAAQDPRYEPNIAALAGVVPADLAPEDIVARLGASWVEERHVQQFLREVLEDPNVVVEHAYGSGWTVKGNK